MKLIPGSHDSATRLAAAAAALVTVGAGLGLRAAATGSVAKYGGDALYTVLLLILVVLVAPRLTPLRAAATALAASWAVEFLQLTALPADLSRHSTVARLVLGSTFNAPDLFWYAAGAAAGWLLLTALRPSGPYGRAPMAFGAGSPSRGR
ncbi:ribosomal maturation YjgA family protein [Streptomyces avidinii]|uniref:DUF2809 domain-containing protein n=1 Tax=Streptomyces avidinii TaxID=1895 RepID=A0ABS4LGT6_STRAV|nr:DUF2809 domain-containing protein [Streptomyces avidinii]MBP2041190.1 hypothetical protein [Streptomyces avidinii]GGZ04689.1 hypothetical protein GCM10010343_33370 [Streptomyces avidinii]